MSSTMTDAASREWQRSTIGEQLRLVNGFGFKPHDWKESGIPIVRIQNLNDNAAPFDYVQGTVDERFHVVTGDLLFAWSGSRGTSFGPFLWERGNAVLNQHIFNVRIRNVDELDKSFCYYWLKFLVPEIEQSAHGSAGLVHVTRKELERFRFPVVPEHEQHEIARILTTLDNLIQKTEALIAKYQAVKQGMMNDLFTRGVDDNGHLRPTYEEAPDLYKPSELGWIPKQWEPATIADVTIGRPKNGYSPKESDEWTGTLMLGLSCLTISGFAPIQLKHAPQNDPNLEPALLRDGDILISRSNTRELVGLVGRYSDIGVPCIYPDLMMRIVPSNRIRPAFLETALRHAPVRRQLTGSSCGTSGSMMKINSEMVLRTCLPLPPAPEQDTLLERCAGVDNLLQGEHLILAKLCKTKSGLMQDLLTGKVRVKDDNSQEVTTHA